MNGLDAADYLLIAEAVLGIDAERLARQADLGALESALHGWGERYSSLAQQAAGLCADLVHNRPLADGNKRVAYVTMIEFVERNGGSWVPPAPDDAAATIERLADRELSDTAFAVWVAAQLA
jgi:death on curing protein